MTHRADQIIEAVTKAIESFVPSTIKVYAHRRLSLAEDQDELPAISVDFGEDQPTGDDGSSLMDGTIASLLTLNITGIATSFDEPQLRRQLLQIRAYVHGGIKQNHNVGLPFVIDTHYGGANPPEFDVSSDMLVGELTSAWGVRYEMNLNNPE